jgi:predicted acyl esterase
MPTVAHRFSRRATILAAIALVLAVTQQPAALGASLTSVTSSTSHAVAHRQPSPTPYPGGQWEPGPPQYGAQTVTGVPVTMDDGVTLYADIAYPTDLATGQRAAGTFPVALTHTVYANSLDTYFTQYGYISIAVCSRGTCEGSGGNVQLYNAHDGLDGKEIINWAAHLPGSDGRVGEFGCSAPAQTGFADAALVGPHSSLKAAVYQCASLDALTHDAIFAGGIPTQTENILSHFGDLEGGNPATIAYFQNLQTEISNGGPAAYDGAFWQSRDPLQWAQDIVNNNVPTLLWSGWSDLYAQSALATYTAFQNAYDHRSISDPMRPDQSTTPQYQLIMGNWAHGGGLDDGIVLEWFDTWVKGMDTGLQRTRTPLHFDELGSNRYVNAAQYPSVSDYTRLYLGSDSTLQKRVPATTSSESLVWAQPSVSGALISYSSQPFRHGATLSGPIAATVYASSSNTNMELIAKLYDVAPNGAASFITQGTVLGSQSRLDHSKSWTNEDNGISIRPWTFQNKDIYLVPNHVYKFDAMLFPTQWGLAPGHEVQLRLATQTPSSDCASLIGLEPCYLTAPQQASIPGGTYTILQGPAFPTSVNLPLLPYMAFPTAASGATPTSNGVAEPLAWGSPHRHR